jgi:Fe-S cluster assembly protein SufD
MASTTADSAPELTVELPAFKGKPGWEFTPLGDLDLDAYPIAPAGELPEGEQPLLAPAAAVTPSAVRPTSEGPLVMPLATARETHAELVERYLGTVAKPGYFASRNDEHWTDGHFVYIPRGVQVDAPILLTTVHQHESTTLHHRTLVVLEEGAEAEVWDQVVSAAAGTDGIVNGVVELVVGPNANLKYVGAQDLNEKTWVFGSQRAVIDRDGQLDWVALGFGSKNGKVFLETQLREPGAHAAVTGAYATRGRQHLDYDTLQEHAAAHTTSDLAFRGILLDRSSAVWRGMIQVDPGAQQTDAFQESRNLLLSKKAHADAIPGLEILADDVRCTHAAAIAQIDPEQVFYLRTRGLNDVAAKRLVVEGFLAAIVERFSEGSVRDGVARALEQRLEEVLGA